MSTIVDLKVKIGSSSFLLNSLPCVVDSSTPIISWEIPDSLSSVDQARFNIKITALEGDGLFINGSRESSDKSFQYSASMPMTSKFRGLCQLEVAISMHLSGEYEYTSGPLYFVYDDVSEVVRKDDSVSFRWTNSIDKESSWGGIKYNLIVSNNPLFTGNSIIINELIDPSSQTSTSYPLNINPENKFYYWKVRAYDGLDYGDFTRVNGFSISDNTAPILTINNVTPLGDSNGDVLIDLTINDNAGDICSLEFYYKGGLNPNSFVSALIMEGIIRVIPGRYVFTWRSGYNEKKISGNYQLRIAAYDSEGLYGFIVSPTFFLDNSKIGLDAGGDGNISNNYPLEGRLARITMNQISDNNKLEGIISVSQFLKDRISKLNGSMGSSSYFSNDNITNYSNKHIKYPAGMKLNQVSSDNFTDYNSSDPDFVPNSVAVDSNGNYQELDFRYAYKKYDDYVFGFIRMLRFQKYVCQKDICDRCNGKGWTKDDLVLMDNPPNETYKYIRGLCTKCNGNGFFDNPLKYQTDGSGNIPKLTYTGISDYVYIPMGDFFNPKSVFESLDLCKIGASEIEDIRRSFVWGNSLAPKIEEVKGSGGVTLYTKPVHHQKVGMLFSNEVYHTNGFYDGTRVGNSRMAINAEHDLSLNGKLEGNMGPTPKRTEEHISPIHGYVTNVTYDYVPGITYDEDIFMQGHPTPTHKWEPGIFKLTGSLYKESPIQPLRIIYLQQFWNEYNTIHWQGPVSVNTSIQLQFCKINSNGNSSEYQDIISENSIYNSTANCYLIPPMMSYCFWRTTSQIALDAGYTYRLRIRQYNLVSKTFSTWVYSSGSFNISNNVSNTANIFYVDYKKFTKELYIYFRLDDPNNEDYDVLNVSYSINNGSFIEIPNNYLSGRMKNLSSFKGQDNGNEHLIIWKTGSMNLEAGDDYRLRINVIRTRYVAGYTDPIFVWNKNINTYSDYYKRQKEKLIGYWQNFYINDDGVKKRIQDSNSTDGNFIEGTIPILERQVEEIKRQNSPLPDDCYGYYSFLTEISIYNGQITVINGTVRNQITINGVDYRFSDWMSYDSGDGISRNDKLHDLSSELASLYSELETAEEKIIESVKFVRKNLIDQGYYCNGYINNDSQNGKFVFEVLPCLDGSWVDGEYIPVENEAYGNTITTIISEEGTEYEDVFTIKDYTRLNGIYSRVQIDAISSFDSQSGFPLRDIIYDSETRIPSGFTSQEYNSTESNTVFDPIEISGESANAEFETDLQLNESSYSGSYQILKDDLPGEKTSDISVYPTFEGDYYWRVGDYNLLYGRPEEEPFYSETHTSSQNITNLKIKIFGDKDLKHCNISNIKYIDEYSSEYDFRNEEEVQFITDPEDSDIESGDCSEFRWMPLSKDRTSPCVIFDEYNNFNMWFVKSNDYGQKIIAYAKGKKRNRFAEYNTSIPYDNVNLIDDIPGATNVFGHSLIKTDNGYIVYFTVQKDGYKIYTGYSRDGEKFTISQTTGISGIIYNTFSRIKNGKTELFYCCYEGSKSVVKKSISDDGIYFYDEVTVVESEYNISNIFVLNHEEQDIFFYTVNIGEDYRILNTSNGIFPIVEDATSIYIIKDFECYRAYVVKNDKIYISDIKNYIEKDIFAVYSHKEDAISGNLNYAEVSIAGSELNLIINAMATYAINYLSSDYVCTEGYRNIDKNAIKKYIIYMENSEIYKEFMIMSDWLDSSRLEDSKGTMKPYPYSYSYLVKELFYR